ncbi:hypothetical protein ACJVC5_07615 [Peredibacter sp. HCB2-198]|uniref:hypothetical protein n=1 Tax=Peredibacter sp. HCB2-198 TaxID=3383025 RepID=UPI0038B5240D
MIVLIDNDILIHLGWQVKASKTGLKLRTFSSIQDFLRQANEIKEDVTIYIDSDLGNGIQGEFEAKKLFDMGYQNLYLATGYSDLKLKDYPWLKGIVPKSPPF